MRSRAWAAAVLLAALLHPAGRQAAAAPTTLTITGNRNSYATITVREDTYYWLDTAHVDFLPGRWGGFAMRPVDDPTLWTTYDDPRNRMFDGRVWHGDRPSHSSYMGILKPGRHRIYLFTDGQQVTVTLRWTGPTQTLKPSTPLSATISETSAVMRSTGETVAAWNLPQDGAKRSSKTHAGTDFSPLKGTTPYIRTCFARTPPSWDTCERKYWGLAARGGIMMGQHVTGVTKGLHYLAEVHGLAVGTVRLMSIRFDP